MQLDEIGIDFIVSYFIKKDNFFSLINKYDVRIEELKKDFFEFNDILLGNGFDLSIGSVIDITTEITDLEKIWNPTTPIIHIIQNCNSPCVMCDCWKTRGYNQHSLETLKPLFDDLKMKNVASVMISGGEPLLHNEIKQIISYLNEKNIDVELNTNGLLLHKHLSLLQHNISEIVISMDTTNPNKYQFLRGVNGFDKVWKNIKTVKAIKPNQNIGLRVTVSKDFLFNIKETINFFFNNSIDFIGFSPLDVSSTSFSRKDNNVERAGKLTKDLLPNEEELTALKYNLSKDSDISAQYDK